jgi:hypothetical protein
MTWSMLVTTLRRIRALLLKVTAGVQPWDWDELPARRWWDVYTR